MKKTETPKAGQATGGHIAALVARHYACPPCHGDCHQGRSCPADAPAVAMTPRDAWLCLAIIAAPWVIGVTAFVACGWP